MLDCSVSQLHCQLLLPFGSKCPCAKHVPTTCKYQSFPAGVDKIGGCLLLDFYILGQWQDRRPVNIYAAKRTAMTTLLPAACLSEIDLHLQMAPYPKHELHVHYMSPLPGSAK